VQLDAPGSAGEKSRSADDKSGSTDDKPGSYWERQQQSNLGKKISSLGTLLVHLEIIATTYRSKYSKTHAFSLYSHLSIYIATHLHTVYLDRLQVVFEHNTRCTRK
jgi:hypothetical protein